MTSVASVWNISIHGACTAVHGPCSALYEDHCHTSSTTVCMSPIAGYSYSFVGNLISLGTAGHLPMCTRRGQGLDRLGFNLSNCLEGKQYTKYNDLQYVVVLSF